MQKTAIPKTETTMVKGAPLGKSASLAMDPDIVRLLKLLAVPKPQVFVKIPTRKGFLMLRIDDILRIETHSFYARAKGLAVKNGDGNSTHIFTVLGDHFRMARKICEWKEILKMDGGFIQTHQSHLVNFPHIHKVYEEDGMIVEMVNRDRVPVSEGFKNDLIKRLLDGGFGQT